MSDQTKEIERLHAVATARRDLLRAVVDGEWGDDSAGTGARRDEALARLRSLGVDVADWSGASEQPEATAYGVAP